jgi:class 3 adenylate cyclase
VDADVPGRALPGKAIRRTLPQMSRKRGLSVLVTVMFTDIVGSTEIGAELGDRRWRDLVRRHHAIVRRELKRFRGRELDTAGDGFFARFDRPADGIRCACAISDGVRELGIEIRAGLHLGEAEVLEHKVGGIAVNVGARVMGVAKGGEVLVSSTLRDAVAGSGFAFADHGSHRLKGIEGEWRLYEVTSAEGERRSLPLSAEEARTRREYTEAAPVHRTRDRVLAGAAGALVVALVAAGILTNALGGDEPGARKQGLTDTERALVAVVPESLRSRCDRAQTPLLDARASVTCARDPYVVSYSRFETAEQMQERFDAFAAAVVTPGGDCATDPAALHEYQVNGIARGDVACHVEDRRSGLSTAASVIVWTDEELLVLARAVRGDGADLTLYEWWRTEAGPSSSSALPEKDGRAELLTGIFEMEITNAEAGTDLGSADPSWVRSWTMKLSLDDGFVGMPTYPEDGGNLFFAKPRTVIFYREGGLQGFGARCPSYQAVRWTERGDQVVFSHPEGHCREWNLDAVMFKPWTRIA